MNAFSLQSHDPDRPAPARAGLDVLVVDDDPILRAVVVAMLSGEGFNCTEADDGDVALDQLCRARADLVITDLVMPRLDGFAMIKAVRQQAPNARIIAVSGGFPGMDADLLLSMAHAMGVDAITTKPLRREAFLGLVRDVLASAPA